MTKKKLTADWLKSKKIPAILIPGLILAGALGWGGWRQLENYKQNKIIFPDSGIVTNVVDGDTFTLDNISVRLIGVDAPANDASSTAFLKSLILNKKVWLEYDRYQDDKYGRVLAWIWTNCESTPQFLPADYMYKSQRESNLGLVTNPEGCQKGKLVQEELVKSKMAITIKYKERGEGKYEKRLYNLTNAQEN
ncbi:MAG: thermonuclease family protein [Candidatus Amesbacteria bacterium]|nr:thermonuclease family protein [Candidatus Amesbacteria bacterium]